MSDDLVRFFFVVNDRDGRAISLDEWGRLLGDPDYVTVAKTTVGDAEVSTVWLGIDHAFGFGPPLIFETMIFGGEHDGDMWRYTSKLDAIEGHEAVVAGLRAERLP